MFTTICVEEDTEHQIKTNKLTTNMKNLLLAILLFVSVAAVGQVTVAENPSFISPATTTVQYVDLPGNQSNQILIYIKCPSTNVGTVQVNCYGSTMTNAPAMAAGDGYFITVYSNRFWIKLSNSADDLIIAF